jgi:hypothetical protein
VFRQSSDNAWKAVKRGFVLIWLQCVSTSPKSVLSSHLAEPHYLGMWIFTRYGFYSIACAQKPDGSIDPQTVMVRARARRHLVNLQARFKNISKLSIRVTPRNDYRFRLIVAKSIWCQLLSELAAEQEWRNFKGEAARFGGDEESAYLDALHAVWGYMYRFGIEE